MNRILVCGPRNYDKVGLIKAVLDDTVTFENVQPESSQSGIILEDLPLTTRYFTADIGVFIDEPDTDSSESYTAWLQELCDPEAKDLRECLQLIVLVFDHQESLTTHTANIEVLSHLMDSENLPLWDGDIAVVLADTEIADEIPETDEMEMERKGLSLKELREMARLVAWPARTLSRTDASTGAPQSVDTALVSLRGARSRNRGEITDADRELVTSITETLLG